MKTLLTLFLFFGMGTLITTAQSDISGILTTAGVNGEEFNSICIKFENSINDNDKSLIRIEMEKYPGFISANFAMDQGSDYVYVKYTNELNANQLLAILDKLNKRGHYMNGTDEVYYQKDHNTYYIR